MEMGFDKTSVGKLFARRMEERVENRKEFIFENVGLMGPHTKEEIDEN